VFDAFKAAGVAAVPVVYHDDFANRRRMLETQWLELLMEHLGLSNGQLPVVMGLRIHSW